MNAQDDREWTPLDLVEGRWEPFTQSTPVLEKKSSKYDLFYDNCFLMEDNRRATMIGLLKSQGAKGGRDLLHNKRTCPITLHPVALDDSPPSASALSTKTPFSDDLLHIIKSHKQSIDSMLNSSSMKISDYDCRRVFESMKKLKIFKSGGSRILCLDGGGLKGLIQIENLIAIEAATGRKITELFDWIIGTSIGALITLSLVYGGYESSSYKIDV